MNKAVKSIAGAPVTLAPIATSVVAPESNVLSFADQTAALYAKHFDWSKADLSTKAGVLETVSTLAGHLAGLSEQSATRKLDVAQLVFRASGKGMVVAKETAGKLTVKEVYEHFSKDAGDAAKVQSVSKLAVFHKLAKVTADPKLLWDMVDATAKLAGGSKYEAVLKVCRKSIEDNAVLGDNEIKSIVNAPKEEKDEDKILVALTNLVKSLDAKIKSDDFKAKSDYFAKVRNEAQAQLTAYKATIVVEAEQAPAPIPPRNFDF